MPVSHLALNVSNIQEACSFYLSALQPLGYRYIGHQGNSIGFGEKDADFFLCQSLSGRPSPTHIAFSATSTLQVRECYAAALNAGGVPSGTPSHRNSDCGCFNAAVEDLDGNTIEFILREPCEIEHEQVAPASSEHSRVLDWQEDVARSGAGADDAQSMTSLVSKAKSRAQTALDLASTTSKSIRSASQAPVPGIARTKTEPVWQGPENGSKALVGTLLGAAAGAAFAFAMCQSERDNARDEASFAASTRSRPLERSTSLKGGRSRSNYEGKSTVSKRSHRNFSTTESKVSSRYPPRSMPRTMQRLLQPTAHNEDDPDVQDVMSRYTQSKRPAPPRSQTYDALDCVPAKSHISSNRGVPSELKRSSTLPIEGPYLLEAPSRRTSRRGSAEEEKLDRHDSAVSVHSRRSEARRSSASKAGTAQPPSSRRDRDFSSASKAPSARTPSHRDRDRDYDTASKASTLKPLKRSSTYDSAADIALPPSRSPTYYSTTSRPTSAAARSGESYVSAVQVPPPLSRASGGRYDTGPAIPIPDPVNRNISDLETVVPEDSISCVDHSSSGRSKKSGSRHVSSKRSEASTVKPAKKRGGSGISAATLPVRAKEEHYEREHRSRSGRSLMGFA